MIKRELVIVGGGPAGMAAALAAVEHGVKDVLIVERDQFLGGILNQCIHTGFGLSYFKEILSGPEYAQRFIDRIKATPAIEISRQSFVVKCDKSHVLTVLSPGNCQQIKAKAIIMATGCRERTREMIHVAGSRPAGIYSAGLAQKFINIEGLLPGKKIVIIGSGDIGLIMARRFSLEGAQVKAVIEIQAKCMGLLRNMVQCVEDFNIPFYARHRVLKIHGNKRVEKVSVAEVDNDLQTMESTKFEIACDTVLFSVGLIPENELIEGAGALIDKNTNSPISKTLNMTSLPGIFVCGNAFKVYDLVDSVSRDSEVAGRLAADFVRRGRS